MSSSWFSTLFGGRKASVTTSSTAIEPKVFLANERTFLAWLDMAVTLASVAVAIVALSEIHNWPVEYGLILLTISIGFCIYAINLYLKRVKYLRQRQIGPYEELYGPIAMACILSIGLTGYFAISLYSFASVQQDDL